MKIIALYLPQYHQIPQNDLWWGNGYTEWTSLKRGKKLIDGQYQPRVPLNENYYDLVDIDVMKWQVSLAKKYGVYGFCFYHYWFNGQLLLEKPIEQFLENEDIEFPFYLCWANETWTTVWEGDKNPTVLASHDYSDKEDVDKHFYYFLKYFKDKRYMRHNGRPILSIYNPIAIDGLNLKYMLERWNELAQKEGFDGISYIYLCSESMHYMTQEYKDYFEYGVEYEPSYVEILEKDVRSGQLAYKKSYIKEKLVKSLPFLRGIGGKIHNRISIGSEEMNGVRTIRNYDDDWEKILSIQHDDYSKYIPGGFVDWDNTPRRGERGKVILGASPDKFEKYLERLIDRARTIYHTDTIVVFAWNEWSEGGYLEPDEKWHYGYLEAIKTALENKKEWPKWD